ncbi:MAG: hypothetical protein GYA36_23410 [Veillonellaceae bacterium]|nr:hypothetical protein [Veillonellaceae bacterium]
MKRIIIALILLSSLAVAERPSDHIKYKEPAKLISLQNVDPSSINAIADMNEPLSMFRMWELPNIGHYASWAQKTDQTGLTDQPNSLLNFTNTIPDLPASVGNSSGNVTLINDTFVWF